MESNRKRLRDGMAHRQCIWICQVCAYPKNKDFAPKCEICGTEAPKTRFGIKIEGRHYLCSVKKSNAQESDMLVLVDANPTPEYIPKIVLSLDSTVEELEERTNKTLEAFRRNFEALAMKKASEEVEVDIAERLTDKHSKKALSREMEKLEIFSSTYSATFAGTFGETRALVAATIADARRAPSDEENKGAPKAKTHHGTTLFDRVLCESRGQVYDRVLGAYLPKTHPIVTTNVADPKNPAAHSFYGLEEDFNYVKGMEKERNAMAQKVEQEAEARRNPDAQRSDLDEDKPQKTRLELLYADSAKPVDLSELCTLCERKYHPRNLVGIVPFNAVAKWREARGAAFDPSDHRFNPKLLYEQTFLCVFCAQFFDKNFSDYLCYHRGKTAVKDPILLLEGDRSGSELDPRITRNLQEFVRKKGRLAPRRPVSRMAVALSMAGLRMKRDLPLLMSDLGCELARYSKLQSETRKQKYNASVLIRDLRPEQGKKRARGVQAANRLYAQSQALLLKRRADGEAPVPFVPEKFPEILRAAERRRPDERAAGGRDKLGSADDPEEGDGDTVHSSGTGEGTRRSRETGGGTRTQDGEGEQLPTGKAKKAGQAATAAAGAAGTRKLVIRRGRSYYKENITRARRIYV